MSRGKRKRRRKPEKTRLYEKCLRLAGTIAKTRDGYCCRRCGRKKAQGYKIDASHIIPKETNKWMATDPDNIKALCARCHRWWHNSPLEAGTWFAETYPLIAMAAMDENTRKPGKPPTINYWRQRVEILTEMLARYDND